MKTNRHYLIVTILAVLLTSVACKRSSPRSNGAPLPVFDGVETHFTLTRSRIKRDQPLEVHVVFHNLDKTVKIFRFLDFYLDARIYSNGQKIEDKCPAGEVPVHEVRIEPGQTFEITTDVVTPVCYELNPGQYSIQFNYNLRVLTDENLRREYEGKYGFPVNGIVPWDGRDHPFTVAD